MCDFFMFRNRSFAPVLKIFRENIYFQNRILHHDNVLTKQHPIAFDGILNPGLTLF